MTLWTIQPDVVWDDWQARGVMSADLRYVDHSYREAYRWMTREMRRRLPSSKPRKSPLWAWYQYDGIARRRPDLRSSRHLPKGTHGVRIEFEATEDAVLLSDFELWHYVLNQWYLATSEEDDRRFESRESPSRNLVRASWVRILDLEWSDPHIAAPRDRKSIQATLWSAPVDAVREVTEFVAR